MSGSVRIADTTSSRFNGILDYFETRRRGFSIHTWDGPTCLDVRIRFYNNASLLLTGVGVEVFTTDDPTRRKSPDKNAFNITFLEETPVTTEDATTEHTTGDDTTTELNTPEDTPTEPNTPNETTTEQPKTPAISAPVVASISTGAVAAVVIVILVTVTVALVCVVAKYRNKFRRIHVEEIPLKNKQEARDKQDIRDENG